MKEITFIIVCFIAMGLIIGLSIAQVATTKQVPVDKGDKELLIANGFDGLPYSSITCDGKSNCTYYITRADKDFVRDLGTKDSKIADKERDKDIQKYMDDSLVMLKEAQQTKDTEGKIEVTEKK